MPQNHPNSTELKISHLFKKKKIHSTRQYLLSIEIKILGWQQCIFGTCEHYTIFWIYSSGHSLYIYILYVLIIFTREAGLGCQRCLRCVCGVSVCGSVEIWVILLYNILYVRYGASWPGGAPAVLFRAGNKPLQSLLTITEKTPTRSFSLLKAHTGAFILENPLRHCANPR